MPTVVLPVAVQPRASVTVTLWVPAPTPVRLEVVRLLGDQR